MVAADRLVAFVAVALEVMAADRLPAFVACSAFGGN